MTLQIFSMWTNEGQELSAATGASQLILKMTSEDQTVDHTNKIMGSDHYTILLDMCTCVRTNLDSQITRLHLLSGLPTSFL